jgi:chromate reductase, NAD(P)H dehydrogenase (quinone)
MAFTPNILCFAGSLRRDSFNKKLVKIAMAGAKEAQAEVTFLDLKEIPLPVFDEDLEKAEGLPENAKKLKQLMKEHQGILLACPEYNSSITAALKNAIDWASRPVPDEKQLECFMGKVAGLMSASPGAFGGLRGLVTVRSILGNIGVIVVPEQVTVGKAHEAFSEDGSLKDEKQEKQVRDIGVRVASLTMRIFKPE